jgi:hypothetical protein
MPWSHMREPDQTEKACRECVFLRRERYDPDPRPLYSN